MSSQPVTIVLGASGGLAEAVLEQLAAAGHALVLQGRDRAKLEGRADGLDGPSAIVCGEIEQPELIGDCWAAAEELGEPFGLVVLTGVAIRLAAEEQTAAALAAGFATNTAGPLLAIRGWCERMGEREGNAVVLSTMQAVYPFEGSLAYAVSKAALEVGVQVLAKDHGPRLRVNAIAPGVNEAGMALSSIARGKYQPYLEAGTIPRYGAAGDVAGAIAFLLTPGLYMTGQTLLLDGGLTLRRDMR